MSANLRRCVITGAPGAGKSTLLAEIAHAGIATYPEVARAILKSPGGMEMRAERPLEFAMAMLEAEYYAWNAAEGALAFYDRGFPDIAGFLDVEGLTIPSALDRVCRELRYTGPVFRARPWREIYTPDDERIQNWEEAVESDAAVSAAWKRYRYDLIDLPLTDPQDRAAFVLDMIKAGGTGA